MPPKRRIYVQEVNTEPDVNSEDEDARPEDAGPEVERPEGAGTSSHPGEGPEADAPGPEAGAPAPGATGHATRITFALLVLVLAAQIVLWNLGKPTPSDALEVAGDYAVDAWRTLGRIGGVVVVWIDRLELARLARHVLRPVVELWGAALRLAFSVVYVLDGYAQVVVGKRWLAGFVLTLVVVYAGEVLSFHLGLPLVARTLGLFARPVRFAARTVGRIVGASVRFLYDLTWDWLWDFFGEPLANLLRAVRSLTRAPRSYIDGFIEHFADFRNKYAVRFSANALGYCLAVTSAVVAFYYVIY